MQLAFDYIGLGSLTKTDMCSKLFDQLGVNKREASDMVDTFFSIISDRLATEDETAAR